MAGERKLRVEILGDAKGLAGAVGDADGHLSKLGSGVATFAKTAAVAFAGAAVAGGIFAKSAIDAASNLNESISKVNTVFGDFSDGIAEFAESAATSVGLSEQAAYDAAGTFGNLFDQMDIGKGQAAKMSTSLITLASDLGSFHNADITEVIEAQTAAFRGEYDSLQRFIPTINAAAVEQKALELTGKKTTKELTAQDKVLATHTLMLEGAGAATGDFARTADGAANKQRILGAQLENLKAKIGQALLPAFTALVNFVSVQVVPVLERFGQWLQVNLPIAIDYLRPKFEAFTAWLSENVPPVLNAIAEFIQTKVIPAIQAIGSFIEDPVIPALQAFAGWIEENLLRALMKLYASFEENILPTLQKIAGFIRDNVLPVLAKIGEWIYKYVLPVIGELVTFVIGDLIPAFFEINAAIVGVIGWFLNLGTKVYDIAVGIINDVGAVLQFFRELPGNIADAVDGAFDGLWEAFRSAINKIIDGWNDLSFKLPEVDTHIPGVGKVGGWSLDTPNLPTLHTGGLFRAPTAGGAGLALLRDGERISTPGQGGESMGRVTVVVGEKVLFDAVQKYARDNSLTLVASS